ncbi:piggyBac transposable element-derived protein 3-like [Sardina pilchardus]|uniref:piggyBac transposable element-derived protein 3-like n=1 Tax=Sardina pilchardus TaxID=27697 RepID=UPI002E0E5574
MTSRILQADEDVVWLTARLFYGKRDTIVPIDPAISDDDDSSEEEENDVADPDFLPSTQNLDIDGPSAKRQRKQLAVEVLEDEDLDAPGPAPTAKRPTSKKKPAARRTLWRKVDLDNPPLPEYQHIPPDFIQSPFDYFRRYFSDEVISHITYQTNLYATQMDINTTFATTEDEIMNFVAILMYMGIAELPAVEDYWALETRVSQVANVMSSKRFKLLKRVVHFNNNAQILGTNDRFFKVRPLFNYLVTAFRGEPETPKQSVDEVMVGYKGKTAGNLKQYIKCKPDKWGFKLFARASQDGFIHDLILYQGQTTLEAHGVPRTPEQQQMGVTSQTVSVLASTMSSSGPKTIFADNYFSGLDLVRYLKSKNCRYTGTARDNRIGNAPLRSMKDMMKKAVPRGACDYTSSDDGILLVRWKDNKIVTLMSTDMGVEPWSTVNRYCSDTKRKEQVRCPYLIKSYNANMGGIDKNDMLVHLYRTPLRAKRWYMRLFAYAIDVSLTNAWIMYRRDSKALNVNDGLSLKHFRIEVFKTASSSTSMTSRPRRSLTPLPCSSADVPTPIRGHRSHAPHYSVRFDVSLFHAPVYSSSRQTCKQCSRKGNIMRSNLVCRVCQLHLCLNAERNCFVRYHEAVA